MNPSTNVAPGQLIPITASSVATTSAPPAKKRFFGKSSGPGKPERNTEGLVDNPRPLTSTMSVLRTQLHVAVDLSGVPSCVKQVSDLFLNSLRFELDKEMFHFCHLVAVCYDLWILVDRQSSSQYGMGPRSGEFLSVPLHDVTCSMVEALSAKSLLGGLKLGTDFDFIVPQIKAILKGAWERRTVRFFTERVLDDDNLTLESFPLLDVLREWEPLRAKASRMAGTHALWRLPDVKDDFSLLAHGVYQSGEQRWGSCGVSALPQRLEKICIALRLIRYERTGDSSFIPKVISDFDKGSAAARCGVYSGIALSRDVAIQELCTGTAPISRV
jgi:hypothetical protein